ncbi:hypothetical protein [Kitasatospora sp. NBC_00458]|uniref:hypothetical protein n=1 Tax=Kitasatospora sp. NBC_00458 TaxID=2903568 RepID=UPI002E17037D
MTAAGADPRADALATPQRERARSIRAVVDGSESRPVEGCSDCARLDRQMTCAQRVFDYSGAVDARVLLRRHHAGAHR